MYNFVIQEFDESLPHIKLENFVSFSICYLLQDLIQAPASFHAPCILHIAARNKPNFMSHVVASRIPASRKDTAPSFAPSAKGVRWSCHDTTLLRSIAPLGTPNGSPEGTAETSAVVS
jgi:hypothetical protein